MMDTLKRYKILVVDNNETYLDVFRFKLKDLIAGAIDCIDEAYHGLHAIELIQDKTYDVVFMDVDMPVLDGVDTTKFLRLRYPDLKIIALSHDNNKEHLNAMIHAGASEYLAKDNLDDNALLKIFRDLDVSLP